MSQPHKKWAADSRKERADRPTPTEMPISYRKREGPPSRSPPTHTRSFPLTNTSPRPALLCHLQSNQKHRSPPPCVVSHWPLATAACPDPSRRASDARRCTAKEPTAGIEDVKEHWECLTLGHVAILIQHDCRQQISRLSHRWRT